MSLDNLPVGWLKVSLGECLDIVRGASPRPKGDPKYFGGDIAWISIKDINAEKGRYLTTTRETVTQLGADKSRLLEEGSLILSNSGSVCIPKILKIQGCIHDGFVTFPNLNKYFSVDYFYHYFNYIRPAVIEANKQGVTQVNLNTEIVKGLDVILPSTLEQQEIVRQLDVMLAQVEQIKARLDAIPAILKKFRQSVLADAVSGKLTEEWRDFSGITFDTWSFEKAEELCLKVQSGSTPRNNPFDQNGTIPFLKVYNIVDQKIAFDYKPQFILEEVHKNGSKRSICKAYDVLMNIVGPPLGKVAIVTDQYPEWNINQAITMFRVDPEKLDYKFLYYVLCEGQIVRDVLHETKGSVGQINISLSQCRNAIIPKPKLSEQQKIVEQIDLLFNVASKLEETVQAAQKRVNLLTQSILAKAFSGELTAEWRERHQDLITGVNSAEALLAKIQAEREASKPVKKTRKAKTV